MKNVKERSSPTQKVLNIWAIILIIWSIYRSSVKLPEWFDEFIAKPIIFILPVYYYISHIEKKNFIYNVGLKTKKIYSDILIGLVGGLLFYGTSVFTNYLRSGSLLLFNKSIQWQSFLLIILTAFATAISEEILSRGFVFKRLYEESHNLLRSSFSASILFFLLHVPILFTNGKITGNFLLLVMVTDVLLSMINCALYVQRKSLVVPIFIHAFYNMSLLFFM
jgi:membrane protease YdiL (CAAX protease family)